MSYLVLARKWRPSTFSDLVGQEHVVQTLRNAITQGRVAHAFLFTGARGVGKTTIARILAKALNCLDRDGATTDPCLKCAACTEIALGRDPDVTEIDGASNNGVDDVRRLQETLPYRPSRDRYKVVIIDEVHMLSTGAFNALLKTLEEPPPHVKFIFATTEAHKVPITILSRCQRYDFRLIPTQLIRARLASILTEERVSHDDAAVALVAREAAGSLRDALSLLDQVLAGVEGDLTGAAAAKLLGVADHKVLYDLARAMLSGDAAATLKILDTVVNEGFDLGNVSKNLLGVLRDLVVSRVVNEPGPLLDLADEERAEVTSLAASHDAIDLERLFAGWAKVTEEVARAREPRWVLEMGAVRLAHRPPLLPADDLVARLMDMERRLSSGSPPPRPTGSSPGGGGGGGAPRPGPAASASPASGQRPSAPQASGPVTAPTMRATTTAPSAAAPAVSATATAAAPSQDWLARARAQTQRQEAARAAVAPSPAQSPQAQRVAAQSPPEEVVDVACAMDVMPTWRSLVAAMDHALVPVLKGAVPLRVDGSVVRLAIDARDSFFRKKLATPEAQEVIAVAAEKVFGARPTIELAQGSLPDEAPTLARLEEAARNEARRQREETARAHPSVKAVCEVLGGEVLRVRFDDDQE